MTKEELERRLWNTLKDAANNEAHRKVRISRLADRGLPVPNKQWTVETVKKWENTGLVLAYQNGAVACLTKKGVMWDLPEGVGDSDGE